MERRPGSLMGGAMAFSEYGERAAYGFAALGKGK